MAEALLTKADIHKYIWTPTDVGGKQTFTRPLAGGEIEEEIWHRFAHGEQILFFGVTVDASPSQSQKDLIAAVRDSWIWLRFHIPTVCTSVAEDDASNFILKYTVASAKEAELWAERTVLVSQDDNVDIIKLRGDVSQQEVPLPDGHQTWLRLVLGPLDASGSVNKFGLLLHTSHTPFDGSAVKIIFAKLLKQLTQRLATGQNVGSSLSWGQEGKNLPPAIFSILSPNEPLPIPLGSEEEVSFAHPYYGPLGGVFQDIGASMQPTQWGYKPRDADTGRTLTRQVSLELTKEESDLVFRHLKSPSGKSFTLGVFAHAALAMSVVAINPPGPDAKDHFLNHFALADGRDLLVHPYSARDGYAGYCLCVTMSRIPISLFLSPEGTLLPLDKTILGKTCKTVQSINEAAKHSGRLSNMLHLSEVIGMSLRQGWTHNAIPPNHCYAFSNDGAGERLLDPVYTEGKTSLKVTNLLTSVNRIDPGPFARVSSWEGIIKLALDYNANIVQDAEIDDYLTKWKKFVLLAAQLTDDDF